MNLTAFYDLAYSPPSYEIISFLLSAELKRREIGAEGIDVRILPGPVQGFRMDTLSPQDPKARRSMLESIVEPCCWLLPTVKSVSVETERPANVNKLKTPSIGLNDARYGLQWLLKAAQSNVFPFEAEPAEGQPFVTITLREAEYWPSRNSNLREWLEVAQAVGDLGYRVIFIRDTAKADEAIEGFETSPLASRDLRVRAQLYGGAAMNLSVSNGPAWLPLYLRAPMIVCKLAVEGAVCADPNFFKGMGLPVGSQIPNARSDQRLLWTDDRAGDVLAAFRDILLREAA